MAIDYPNSIDVQEVNDEIWFDIINRTITLKEGQSIQDILVQNDANSRNFGFMIQRYFENEDLSTKNIRIHYVNSLNQHDFAFAHSIEVVGENKDVLSFQWLISAKVCLEVGNVQFAIEFYDENGYALFTTPAMVSVSKGVYTLGSIPDPDYDWVKSFAESMAGKEDKRNRVKEISNDGDDNHYPTAKAVIDFVNKSNYKVITEPCHIAELEEGIYIVKGSDIGDYTVKVTFTNIKEDGQTIDDDYFVLNKGLLVVSKNIKGTDDDGNETSVIDFTAQGLITVPNQSYSGSRSVQQTINGTTSIQGYYLESIKLTAGFETFEANKWYSEMPKFVLSDIPALAIENEITTKSTIYDVPSALAVRNYVESVKAEILAEIKGNT